MKSISITNLLSFLPKSTPMYTLITATKKHFLTEGDRDEFEMKKIGNEPSDREKMTK